MKEGFTYLAYKFEHTVDFASNAMLATEIDTGNAACNKHGSNLGTANEDHANL